MHPFILLIFLFLGSLHIKTQEQLKKDPTNTDLQILHGNHLAQLQNHELYQKCIQLGLQAAALRYEADDKFYEASKDVIEAIDMLQRDTKAAQEASHYNIEAGLIKKNILEPLRELTGRPTTPPSSPRMKRFTAELKGVKQSLVDTAKGIGDLAELSASLIAPTHLHIARVCLDVAKKVSQGETNLVTAFKESIENGHINIEDSLKSFYNQAKHAWENKAEYKARLQLQKEIAQYQDLYSQAFDAENYHLKHAERFGYWTGEILQCAPLGVSERLLSALAQGAVKSAKWAKGIGEGVKAIKVVDEVEKSLKLGVATTIATKDTTKSASTLLQNIFKPEGKIIGVQKGTNPLVRTITETEAEKVIKQLMDMGAKEVEKSRYLGGTWYELPQGGGFGIRLKSSTASLKHGTPNTIDLHELQLGIEKLKY